MFARTVLVALVLVIAWASFARTSDGAAPARAYVVKPGDTLWSIANRTYAGDPRGGIWKIEQRNGVRGGVIRAGQRLVLPAG